jgi:hypothetical protein
VTKTMWSYRVEVFPVADAADLATLDAALGAYETRGWTLDHSRPYRWRTAGARRQVAELLVVLRRPRPVRQRVIARR